MPKSTETTKSGRSIVLDVAIVDFYKKSYEELKEQSDTLGPDVWIALYGSIPETRCIRGEAFANINDTFCAAGLDIGKEPLYASQLLVLLRKRGCLSLMQEVLVYVRGGSRHHSDNHVDFGG